MSSEAPVAADVHGLAGLTAWAWRGPG